MAKAPSMHYKPWSAGEVRTLKKLARQQVAVAKIAKELKRTPFSVLNRVSREGISLRAR